ncbi:MAG: 50S ribosomal protein L19 [Planctomycetes bacterium]|nr:50S ribosomal protein L19 [Planctomycetota bacterium]MCA8936227.1 50S ribosomal protein L19 [Planctomycetota bacterium]
MTGFAHELERKEVTKTEIPVFHVGDSLDVHVRIKEGEKERIQIFSGVCIARKGGGLRETFTVRRIVEGEGVERIFPLHSPNVAQIGVKRAGKVRRAKLYYLRDRVGKATRIMEKLNATHLGKMDDKRTADEQPAPKAEEKPAEAEAAEKPAEAAEAAAPEATEAKTES